MERAVLATHHVDRVDNLAIDDEFHVANITDLATGVTGDHFWIIVSYAGGMNETHE